MRFAVALTLCAGIASGALSEAERKRIDEVLGAKGIYTAAEDVHKVTFPRTDVAITVDRRQMHPFMGLTSWASFTTGARREVMVMGDLVVFEDEVNPVMSTALDNGLEVTALHNHFFYDQPRVMFMHIGGEGTAGQLARAVRLCQEQIRKIRSAAAAPAVGFSGSEIPAASSINAAPLDDILGVKGQSNSGMYKAVIGRSARMHGRDIGNQMGVNTWAAFAGSDQSAFVDGDFAMHASELQVVLKELRASGIHVVAIHNHMTEEEPDYVFLHYWSKGPAAKLAKSLKSTLEKQAAVSRLKHPSH